MLKSMKLWLGLPCDVYSGAKTQEGAWQTQDRTSQVVLTSAIATWVAPGLDQDTLAAT